jgi:hypothetical protein
LIGTCCRAVHFNRKCLQAFYGFYVKFPGATPGGVDCQCTASERRAGRPTRQAGGLFHTIAYQGLAVESKAVQGSRTMLPVYLPASGVFTEISDHERITRHPSQFASKPVKPMVCRTITANPLGGRG